GVKPETAAPYVSLLYYIKNAESISKGQKDASELGVRALDDFTLEVEMERPTAFFDKMTSHYIFAPLPKWIIEKYGDKWTRPENIVGNGAFKVVEHTPYSQVVAVKNSTYWDAASVKLDKVLFIHLENNSTGLNLYKAGDVYTMQTGSIPLPFLKVLKHKKDYRKGAVFTTYFYSINVAKEPFKDLRVRRALNLAIDKAAITDKLIGKGDVPATSIVPSGVAGYESAKGETYDPEKAKQLLAEAGFAEGKGFPKITIYFNTSDAHRQIAEAVQRMWKETLKINVELQNEEWQTFQARWENRDFDVCRDAWQGDYLDPNAFLELFATKSPNNHCGWTDEKYKSLLDAANSEPDREKRMRMLKDVEQMLVDEMPIIPLYHYGMSYLQKPFVEGWYENLFDIHPMKYVSIDTNWKPELNTASTERRRQ
ncbi:MAG: peptide ABC transporter substrate-binding protein, partial [Blastocatellia bacterium]|nr:peptide ABC transporter substrate-binding protein [Blastocatellia bacterium]